MILGRRRDPFREELRAYSRAVREIRKMAARLEEGRVKRGGDVGKKAELLKLLALRLEEG